MQSIPTQPRAGPWPAIALLGLGLALATAAVLGPLMLGAIEWRVSANSLNQTLGADGAGLLLLAPTCLVAAWLRWQGRPVAAPLAFGVGLASLYYGVASVLGADYVQYPGNNERFFLLFLAIIVLSWTIAAWGWSAMTDAPSPGRASVRVAAIVLVIGGLAIAGAWLVQLTTIATNGALTNPSEIQAYAESPSGFWLVRVVDLGFIVPLAVWSGVGLWRGSRAALRAATGVAAFMTLQAAAVLAMGLIMLLRNDPTATPGLVVVLTPIALTMAYLTLRLLVAYGADPRRGEESRATADRLTAVAGRSA